MSASAPRRWASATTAASRASPRWSSARRPAAIATARATAAPASRARRRRFARRLRSASRSLTRRLVLQELALEPVELIAVLRRPVERGRQPRAAVELARVAPAAVPVPRRVA